MKNIMKFLLFSLLLTFFLNSTDIYSSTAINDSSIIQMTDPVWPSDTDTYSGTAINDSSIIQMTDPVWPRVF